MLDHIAKLRQQRRSILCSCERLQQSGPSRPAERELLASTVELLVLHLEEQKIKFYPAVTELLDVHPDLIKTIHHFDCEISLIREEIIRITNSFMSTGDGKAFHEDFHIFLTGMQLRFLREEQQVFIPVENLLMRSYRFASIH